MTTILAMVVSFLSVGQWVRDTVAAYPEPVTGVTYREWGYPTCAGASEFVFVGFSAVLEAVLVAGDHECSQGWKKEYSGYLVSWKEDAPMAELECVNHTQLYTISSQYKADQALVYFTESTCGELKWPPYKKDAMVTCVVCAKPPKTGR